MLKNLLISGLVAVIISCALFITSEVADAKEEDLIILKDSNTVTLNMPIYEESARDLQVELLEKSEKLSKSDSIYLVLNSPGGNVKDGQDIIDLIKGLPQKVHTISLFSASMSFIISQYLDDRYVTEFSTLMSHRASVGGIQGTVPGTFLSRTNSMLMDLLALSNHVANRAGIDPKVYQDMIADELWMGADKAINLKFADKKVRLRCDKTLQGEGKTSTMTAFGIFTATITFSKCPLIKVPISTRGNTDFVNLFVNNKSEFIRKYIETGVQLKGN